MFVLHHNFKYPIIISIVLNLILLNKIFDNVEDWFLFIIYYLALFLPGNTIEFFNINN